MYSPTTRLLTILELLQARGRLRGADLAARLEVDGRTVRRYITMLQDLGIPIEAERGRHGAYRLRPGFKLPPLVFTHEEALALILGLLTARRVGLGAAAPAVEGALAKVERVLPVTVRERVQAVADTLLLDVDLPKVPPVGEAVVAFSTGVQTARRVRLRYRALAAADTERLVDPYGLVYREGHTYAVGYCHLREEVRVFRLDRVREIEVCDEGFTRPAHFDPVDHVLHTLATVPRAWAVEVLLETTLATARRRVPAAVATLAETPQGVELRCQTGNLDWFAHMLLGLRCPLIVREPPDLRLALRRVGAEAARLAERTSP